MPAEVPSNDAGAPESRRQGAGELLRHGREQLGMSVEQVADSLRLDDRFIEALEAGRFDEIGAPVFVRGHLKAYARILRLNEERVLEAYSAEFPEEPAEPVLTPRASQRKLDLSPRPVALGALALVLAIGLGIYALQDEPPGPAITGEAPPPQDLSPPAVDEAPQTPDPPADPLPEAPAPVDAAPAESVAATPEPAPAPEPEPESVLEPEPGPATAESAPTTRIGLELYFREESWVEISNTDRRILFGLQREGVRRQLAAEPPIQVLLGNAPGVDVYLNGAAYEIPARNINGKVARFTIEPPAGDGS